MTDRTIVFNKRTDQQRRKRQAEHFIRIAIVHRLSRGEECSSARVREIGAEIGVSERTVYRDLGVLREVYEQAGTNKLDEAKE